jgi:adhesin/invasin
MGRPIKKKYFGNTNEPPIGGEGVASVAVSGSNNDYTVKPALAVGAPNLPGGVQAVVEVTSMGVASATLTAAGSGYSPNDVLTVVGLGTGTAATITVNTVDTGGEVLTFTVTTAGVYTTVTDVTDLATTVSPAGGTSAKVDVLLKVNAVTVVTAGSGYTSAPAVTDTPNGNGTFTATLSSANVNAIAISAFVVGGSSAVAGDIVKQEASRRYLVTTAQGTSDCSLVAAPPLAGQMTMTATDSAGGTYYPIKLTQSKALIVKGGRTGTQFDTRSFVISAIARASDTVTVTTTASHSFVDGDQVYIFGVTGSTDTFNGVFNINVTAADTFTYSQMGTTESGTVGANSNASAGLLVNWVVSPESATADESVVIETTV